MKQLLLLSLITIGASAQPIRIHLKKPKPKPAPVVVEVEEEDDDVDGQVVLANVANMLGCIGMLSTDPHNPAIAGPAIAQIGISFINIVTQVFKNHGLDLDDQITRAHVQNWFINLPDQVKIEIINLFIEYSNNLRSHIQSSQECPHCGMSYDSFNFINSGSDGALVGQDAIDQYKRMPRTCQCNSCQIYRSFDCESCR